MRGRRDWVRPHPVATISATSATLALQFKYQPCRVTTDSNRLSPESPPQSSSTQLRHLLLRLSPTSTPITSLLAGNADAVTASSTLNYYNNNPIFSLNHFLITIYYINSRVLNIGRYVTWFQTSDTV